MKKSTEEKTIESINRVQRACNKYKESKSATWPLNIQVKVVDRHDGSTETTWMLSNDGLVNNFGSSLRDALVNVVKDVRHERDKSARFLKSLSEYVAALDEFVEDTREIFEESVEA